MSDPPIHKSIKVEHKRTVNTYARLWLASDKVLETGRAAKAGWSWQYLSSIVLRAFAFEAYLNHIGFAEIPNWKERKPPLFKLLYLAFVLDVDLGSDEARPLQTVHELLEMRNTLAHGRSETLEPEPTIFPLDDDYERHIYQHPLTPWEVRIRDAEFADRAREDVRRILEGLQAARTNPEELFDSGAHLSGASVIDESRE